MSVASPELAELNPDAAGLQTAIKSDVFLDQIGIDQYIVAKHYMTNQTIIIKRSSGETFVVTWAS